MSDIKKILKDNNLKTQEFIDFAGISKMQFHYAMKCMDDIYMAGLKLKLKDFINYKIEKLSKIEL